MRHHIHYMKAAKLEDVAVDVAPSVAVGVVDGVDNSGGDHHDADEHQRLQQREREDLSWARTAVAADE